MSLIGTLEQMNFADLLQRLESFAKSGLLIVQQGRQWVELYFRNGRLICIGPMRTSIYLGSRLLQEGLISPYALQETLQVLGGGEASETKVALTLMDLGYISQETLRDWAAKKAYEVFQVLFAWSSGEVHFEEGVVPPAERLLVAVTVSTLLPALTAVVKQNSSTDALISPVQPSYEQAGPKSEPLQPRLTRASEFTNVPTLTGSEQFGIEPGVSMQQYYAAFSGNMHAGIFTPPPAASKNNAIFTPESQQPMVQEAADKAYVPSFEGPGGVNAGGDAFVSVLGQTGNSANDDSAFVSFMEDADGSDSLGGASGRRQPEPVQTPFMPKQIDTSFMRPEMLLLPVDFSAGLAQNPSVQMTPEQWMVFAQVDGQTSLQNVCISLKASSAQVCQVVGELLAAGLIQLSMPDGSSPKEFSPLARDIVTSGMNTGSSAPGYASMAVPPWSQPTPDMGLAANGFEVQSQWGNAGNGASFIPGQGWIATPQPLQPLQTSRPLNSYPNAYVPAGGNR